METGRKRAAVVAMLVVTGGLCLQAYSQPAESRSNPVPNGSILIDGNFGDWVSVTAFSPDSPTDAPSGDQNWAQVAVAHDDTYIYVKMDRAPGSVPFNASASGATTGGPGYWILLDTDKNSQTGLSLAGVRPFSVGAEYNVGGTSIVNRWGSGGIGCPLGGFPLAQVSALDPNEVEMVVPRSALGDPVEFDLQFVGENSGDFYPNDPAQKFHYSTVAPLAEPLPADVAASRCNPVVNGTMAMDGDVSDWVSVAAFPEDSVGDGGATQDWVRVWVAHDDTNFYFRLERAAGSAPVYSPGYWGWIDTDRDRNTGVSAIGGYTFSVGGEFNFGGTAAINEWNAAGGYVRTFGWSAVGQPGPSSVEIAIRRSEIGDPSEFNLLMVGETSGDYYPDGGANDAYFHYFVHPPGPTGIEPVVVATRSNKVPNGSIVLDGSVSDWAGVEPFPAEESEGGTQDWVQAWIAHDDDNFYFRLERTPESVGFNQLPSGQGYWTVLDTDGSLATGFTGFGARNFSIGGEYNFSGTFGLNSWGATGCFAGGLPFSSSAGEATEVEIAITRTRLQNVTDFNVAFRGENSGDLYPDGAGNYFHYSMLAPLAQLEPGMIQSLSNPVAPGAITIDGNLSDWSGIMPFIADASGDGGAAQDWVQVWIAHDQNRVYLRLKRTPGSATFASQGYWGLFDLDRNPATGVQLTPGIGAELNTGGAYVNNRWWADGSFAGQEQNAAVGIAYPTTVEMAVARATLGNPNRFRVIFAGENSGDYYPNGGGSNQTFRYTVSACPIPFADADLDEDVDMDDFAAWQRCYTGPGGTVTPGCECFDRDFSGQGDGDVDLDDLTAFLNCVSGPAVPADPGCEG